MIISIFFNFQYFISTTSGIPGTELSHPITPPYSSSTATIHQVAIFLGANATQDFHGQLGENAKLPKNRALLHEEIVQNPGITLRELQRETSLALGVIQYHLRNLESNETKIESFRLGRCRHFFERSARYSMKEKLWLASTRNSKIVTILTHITEKNGACFQKDLVVSTGYSRALVSYYIKNLRKKGFIEVMENRLQIAEDFLTLSNLGALSK
ncbi:MAG: winged helix-turn-helix transcriptional regulator [Candidatus Thorarchaeota archaeon]